MQAGADRSQTEQRDQAFLQPSAHSLIACLNNRNCKERRKGGEKKEEERRAVCLVCSGSGVDDAYVS